jgi:hypothetical protein
MAQQSSSTEIINQSLQNNANQASSNISLDDFLARLRRDVNLAYDLSSRIYSLSHLPKTYAAFKIFQLCYSDSSKDDRLKQADNNVDTAYTEFLKNFSQYDSELNDEKIIHPKHLHIYQAFIKPYQGVYKRSGALWGWVNNVFNWFAFGFTAVEHEKLRVCYNKIFVLLCFAINFDSIAQNNQIDQTEILHDLDNELLASIIYAQLIKEVIVQYPDRALSNAQSEIKTLASYGSIDETNCRIEVIRYNDATRKKMNVVDATARNVSGLVERINSQNSLIDKYETRFSELEAKRDDDKKAIDKLTTDFAELINSKTSAASASDSKSEDLSNQKSTAASASDSKDEKLKAEFDRKLEEQKKLLEDYQIKMEERMQSFFASQTKTPSSSTSSTLSNRLGSCFSS